MAAGTHSPKTDSVRFHAIIHRAGPDDADRPTDIRDYLGQRKHRTAAMADFEHCEPAIQQRQDGGLTKNEVFICKLIVCAEAWSLIGLLAKRHTRRHPTAAIEKHNSSAVLFYGLVNIKRQRHATFAAIDHIGGDADSTRGEVAIIRRAEDSFERRFAIEEHGRQRLSGPIHTSFMVPF